MQVKNTPLILIYSYNHPQNSASVGKLMQEIKLKYTRQEDRVLKCMFWLHASFSSFSLIMSTVIITIGAIYYYYKNRHCIVNDSCSEKRKGVRKCWKNKKTPQSKKCEYCIAIITCIASDIFFDAALYTMDQVY